MPPASIDISLLWSESLHIGQVQELPLHLATLVIVLPSRDFQSPPATPLTKGEDKRERLPLSFPSYQRGWDLGPQLSSPPDKGDLGVGCVLRASK